MKIIMPVIAILLVGLSYNGFCEDKVVVVPLISEKKCTGNASSDDVLSGKTFSNAQRTGMAGTMSNNGSINITPSTSSQPIPEGYHNGSGWVEGDPDLIAEKIKKGVDIFGVIGSVECLSSQVIHQLENYCATECGTVVACVAGCGIFYGRLVDLYKCD